MKKKVFGIALKIRIALGIIILVSGILSIIFLHNIANDKIKQNDQYLLTQVKTINSLRGNTSSDSLILVSYSVSQFFSERDYAINQNFTTQVIIIIFGTILSIILILNGITKSGEKK